MYPQYNSLLYLKGLDGNILGTTTRTDEDASFETTLQPGREYTIEPVADEDIAFCEMVVY